MLDFLMHIEQWLPTLLDQYGLWIYAILFLIIFAETGSVFMFFLPGDSLLIAIGALCSTAADVHLSSMGVLLFIASVLGYIVNYYTGKILGFKFFHEHSRFLKPEYIVKTNHYFTKHGGKTILMARFVPFVRSFAPFAAGAGHMNVFSFMFYNITGGLVWIGLLLGIGYGTGNMLGIAVDLF
jgi:membrane-associated protein